MLLRPTYHSSLSRKSLWAIGPARTRSSASRVMSLTSSAEKPGTVRSSGASFGNTSSSLRISSTLWPVMPGALTR